MTETYEPELGQLLYGQPSKKYEVPEIGIAALHLIRDELDRVMWNAHQREYASPFDNSGARYDCDEFSAHAYSWGDDEQPFNFKWKELEISWYKWFGRGTSSNIPVTPQLASDFLEACLKFLRNLDDRNEK